MSSRKNLPGAIPMNWQSTNVQHDVCSDSSESDNEMKKNHASNMNKKSER
jgi:hypothetical protein